MCDHFISAADEDGDEQQQQQTRVFLSIDVDEWPKAVVQKTCKVWHCAGGQMSYLLHQLVFADNDDIGKTSACLELDILHCALQHELIVVPTQ
jgi:hypothetical protein